MKSNGWLQVIAVAIAAIGLIAYGSACTKSSESKESKDTTSDKTPKGDKGDKGTTPETKSPPIDPNESKGTDTEAPETDPKAGTAEVKHEASDPTANKDPDAKKNPVASKNPFTSKTVGGDDSYTLKIKYPNEVKNGAKGTVTFTVIPADGWKMNKDFPTKLTVSAPDGVSVSKDKQKVPDAVEFSDGKAVFAVEFTPSSSGSKAFSAKFKFAVCTSSTCDPKKTELAWNTSVI